MRITRYSALFFAAATLFLGGCMQKSPEKQLEKINSMIQQNDTLGARLACQDLIKSHPDSPQTLEAHMMLASIYAMELQPDEAISELKTVMSATSQNDPIGQQAMKGIVSLEMKRGKTDKALSTIDEVMAKDAKDDNVLKQGLLIMKSQVLMSDKQTTEARSVLSDACKITTSPDVLDMLSDYTMRTYVIEENLDAAKSFVLEQMAQTTKENRKFELLSRIAMIDSARNDYDSCRKTLVELTAMYDKLAKEEMDLRKRNSLARALAGSYIDCGNYLAGETLLNKMLRSSKEMKDSMEISRDLFGVYLRQGDTTGIMEMMSSLSQQFPNGPFAEEKNRIESAMASQPMPEDMTDTRPLVLRFKTDELITPTFNFDTETSVSK